MPAIIHGGCGSTQADAHERARGNKAHGHNAEHDLQRKFGRGLIPVAGDQGSCIILVIMNAHAALANGA
ncbi:hypothetical protein BM221_009140 [Beauveria bassiana]|uniref:Uncharacterized protein n=1 Tax=Beauveria bassiana TaxID=176275 RepID=A0A2N6NCF0_BEABA|nr:hypothetical protein BM221_009140 [Beauveria bassiana]